MRRATFAAVVGICAVFALVLVGRAQAAPFTPSAEADYAFALEWWGVSAPPACATVTRDEVPALTGDGGAALGEATMPLPGERGLPCILRVVDYLSPCIQREIMVHETGHLLGLDDAESGIMAAYLEGRYFCDPPRHRHRHRRHP